MLKVNEFKMGRFYFVGLQREDEGFPQLHLFVSALKRNLFAKLLRKDQSADVVQLIILSADKTYYDVMLKNQKIIPCARA